MTFVQNLNDIASIDFSGLKEFEECPQRFKWNKLERRKPKFPENSYYAICGIVKQKLFEHFYNNEWYRRGAECAPFMEKMAEQYFNDTLKWCNVDFNSKIAKLSKEQLIEEVRDGVKKGIKMIKDHKLITPNCKSEVKLTAKIEGKIPILGKVDFIIRQASGEGWILDGKDTADEKRIPKAVDPRQLWIYSYLYNKCYGSYPTKLGFMFWRHDRIDYIDPVKGVDETIEWAKKTYWEMRKSDWKAKPASDTCFFCKYKSECSAYKDVVLKYKDIPEGDVISFDL
jgi:hypothetical protein